MVFCQWDYLEAYKPSLKEALDASLVDSTYSLEQRLIKSYIPSEAMGYASINTFFD